MRWRTRPEIGWERGFALAPVPLDDGTTLWFERFWMYRGGNGRILSYRKERPAGSGL